MSALPYRHLVVVDERRPARVEAAHCGWCRFSNDGRCDHPVHRGLRRENSGHAPPCMDVNPSGECPYWDPSWLTRWARRLRLGRAPAMVDPRVWDEQAGGR